MGVFENGFSDVFGEVVGGGFRKRVLGRFVW